MKHFGFLQRLDWVLRALYFCIFCQIRYCGPNQDRHILRTEYVLHLLCSHGALCSRSVRQLTAHLVRILSITFTRALKNNCTMGWYFVYFMSWLLQIHSQFFGKQVRKWFKRESIWGNMVVGCFRTSVLRAYAALCYFYGKSLRCPHGNATPLYFQL